MRWKAHFFLHNADEQPTNKKPTYGLRSKRAAPHVPEMKPFEDDVAKMLENIKFRRYSDEFINQLEDDKKRIRTSPNVFIPADKTRNMYEMSAADYDKLLTENVTKTYRLADDNTANDINNQLKSIATHLDIANRIEPMAQTPAFISLKDHKENFENNPQCRLINPAKSNLGKVSKTILDRVNNDIRAQTNSNQWRNTDDTIAWFKAINNKDRHTFLNFDIAEFYPSISEQLLDEAITWAKQYSQITGYEIKIIKHARQSLLFNNNQTWTKTNATDAFDVTMGSYDGAEVCELVGLFILRDLEGQLDNVGLYRDDGLAAMCTTSGRLGDKARKQLIATFQKFGLKITATANLKRVNFLDVTLDLTDGTYKPYRKPNDEPLYINRLSNHPPAITRQLPLSVNKRINKLSCNRTSFDASSQLYNNALRQSNYDATLTYDQPTSNDNDSANSSTQRRNRQRNVIWYNPPYSKNVKTNIGQQFLQLIDKHFPTSNKLHKIFNRHNVRVSYGCLDNMQSFINKHNKKILNQHTKQTKQTQTNTSNNTSNTSNTHNTNNTSNTSHTDNTGSTNNTVNTNSTSNTRQCNCRQPQKCPAEGKCLTSNVVYQAEVTSCSNEPPARYIGVTADNFKTRYRNHAKSFANKKYATETELSKHIWKLKESGKQFSIAWSLLKTVPAYKVGGRRCNLCLEEKLTIMKHKTRTLLNKRSELFTKCRHVTRHLISHCKYRE